LPYSFKIFEVLPSIELGDIAAKIKDYKISEVVELDNKEVEIGTEIHDLSFEENSLKGIITESRILSITYKEKEFKVPISQDIYFEFYNYKSKIYLIIEAKKNIANYIASLFSILISTRKGMIIEVDIPPEELQKICEEKPENIKVAFFESIRIPSVKKLSLYGSELTNTELFQNYLKLGRLWYIVFEIEEGIVIGLTRNGVIPIFSNVDTSTILRLIKERIIPITRPFEK